MTAPERIRYLFGTDGVRDVANRGAMTPEMAMRLARAFVLYLTEHGSPRPRIAVGKDTRRSGAMLESALQAGMMSAGAMVYSLDVFPTPGLSYVVRKSEFDGGAMISASHNPAEYNGIKLIGGDGHKFNDDVEAEIEGYFDDDNLLYDWRPTGASIGDLRQECEWKESYVNWLTGWVNEISRSDIPLAIDSANGAAYEISERIFADWRAKVTFTGNKPDGLNINEGVGVMHLEHLSEVTVASGSKLGIAYDGDTDRVLLCDSRGRRIDGDVMLWIIGRYLAREGTLGAGVVATVMSNMALEEKLAEDGIKTFRCQVGDRYVMETMKEEGAHLGGEQSGHIIASEYYSTGDGLCTGLLFIKSCIQLGEDMDTLVDRFRRYPQLLRNLRLTNRDEILSSPLLKEAEEAAKKRLGNDGRLILRPSGTEPLLRIFVEARDEALTTSVCHDLEEIIKRIGGDAP